MEKLYTFKRTLSTLFLLFAVALISSCSKYDDGFDRGDGSGNNTTGETSNGETGEEEESFDDALVWEYFEINEGGHSVSAVCGYYDSPYNDRNKWAGKVVIPETVNYFGMECTVTGIADNAFSNCSYITAIKIPESVTSIGDYAFSGCSSLTYIKIPEGVTSIGGSAFYECTSLSSISIPGSVTSIGREAFYDCSSLTSIKVAVGNKVFDSREDCNAIIETSSNTLLVGCQNTIIPEGVTSIGNSAFYKCSSLTSISIPDGVTSIEDHTFANCSSLTSISIPNSVTSIKLAAFQDCSSLTSVTCYAEKVPEIDDSSFNYRSSATLYVPASALEKYKAAWYWKGFGKILPIE